MFEIAQSKSLDLVLVNGDAKPPVVKLLDYLAFVREREKMAYQAVKNSKNKNLQKLKSIVLKLKIDEHDLEWKVKKTKQWLSSGEKVQLFIKAPFELSDATKEIARGLCERFSQLIKEEGRAIDQLKAVSKTQYACTFSPELSKQKVTS
ncbi:translation initiation factor 3 [Candidatus Mycoplasma haemominutum 'Birmingham 1']|uniref:Translation initiation factor IF-3 n=2 Tax=Candidatus Mycoplasma haematominutum TaxID=209446 RepID=G8C2U2_9MOLU|nr:translation initiation factor 3 [Candidatus Mycoplasma haematominutum 'Birmingham 1']